MCDVWNSVKKMLYTQAHQNGMYTWAAKTIFTLLKSFSTDASGTYKDVPYSTVCIKTVRQMYGISIDVKCCFFFSFHSFARFLSSFSIRMQLLILYRTFKQIQFSILQIECNRMPLTLVRLLSLSVYRELSEQIYIFIHEFQRALHICILPTTTFLRFVLQPIFVHYYCRACFYVHFTFCYFLLLLSFTHLSYVQYIICPIAAQTILIHTFIRFSSFHLIYSALTKLSQIDWISWLFGQFAIN